MIMSINISITQALIEVKTGDAMLVKGSAPISHAIMHWSEFSHAGLIVRFDDVMPHYPVEQIQVFEAVKDGLTARIFKTRVEAEAANGGQVYWLPVDMPEERRFGLREYALKELAISKPYDVPSLFNMAFGHQSIDSARWFCSEWYAACLVACGFVDWQMSPTPGDIPYWLGSRAGTLRRIIGPKDNEIEV